MSGYSDFVTEIREDLDRGTAFDARIRRAIHSAIQHYKGKRFTFNEARTTATSSAEYLSLSFAWIEIDSLRVEDDSGHWIPLCGKSFDFIEHRSLDPNDSDEPVYYAVYGQQLRFWPIPDRTYSFQVAYHAEFTDISLSASDSASNAWINEGRELTRCHALVELLELYIDGPEAVQKAIVLRGREREEFNRLKSRANRQQGSGHVEPFM